MEIQLGYFVAPAMIIIFILFIYSIIKGMIDHTKNHDLLLRSELGEDGYNMAKNITNKRNM